MSNNQKYTNNVANQLHYPFILPELPYSVNDLMPHMSADTFHYHHGKHHQAYVNKLNELVAQTNFANNSLEEIIFMTKDDQQNAAIFNNAAQIWNHTFFWHSMTKSKAQAPTDTLMQKINQNFGNYQNFKEQFIKVGTAQFGSGWVWLVLENDQLKIIKTSNADLPIIHNQQPLLNCDVWEHAYYLDYQNKRPDFLNTFLDHLINWQFASSNL